MKIAFPSPEFDDTVAAVCHGSAIDVEMSALNTLLRNDPSARDEYLLRIELHLRLASDPDLFSQAVNAADNRRLPGIGAGDGQKILSLNPTVRTRRSLLASALAVAACLILVAGAVWTLRFKPSAVRKGATSTAVAMLTRTVDAHWDQRAKSMQVGGALEPGSLRLESGLAQVVFYSGARMVIEGPTELQLVSPLEAVCPAGRLLLEVPPPARGFRLKTSQLNVVDLGTSFGIDATNHQTALHVFKGKVEFSASTLARQSLGEGRAAVVQGGDDGVLGLTVFGPGNGKFQILASPPAITLDKLGIWQHMTVVIDGKARQVVHYVNGLPISPHPLKLRPPFRVGSAELGNWNARSGPDPAPTLIRNLSGSLDEFELFSRALSDAEVRELYAKGKPDV